jgi:hypothetical protein
MSEYQYFEFQAIDRPLSEADRKALRDLSTRARITATSFTNTYEWGDFKGDPAQLMERWFDLHLYLANWGSRRLMIRWPTRMVNRHRLDAFLGEVDCAELTVVGDNLILDIVLDEVESDDLEDGSGWLAALTPLRAEVLAGDLRLFYLLWLMAVEADRFEADEPEPMPGIGPMTAALEAFAAFFGIDPDLVHAAAERPGIVIPSVSTSADVRKTLLAMTDSEKTEILARLYDGDTHVAPELRAKVRDRMTVGTSAPPVVARTVGELRARARAVGLAREQAAADKLAAEQKRQVEEAEKARRVKLDAIARRGEGVWREVEAEIERRSATGYDRAASLLLDLRAVAEDRGAMPDFDKRLRAIRERHARKQQFIMRLAKIGPPGAL